MGWETEIPDVVAGQPITSVWGNAVRDSIVHTVATVAALPSTGVTDGDVAWVTAVNRLHIRRSARWWSTRTGSIAKLTGTGTGNPAVVSAADIGFVELTYAMGGIQYIVSPLVVFSSTRFVLGPPRLQVLAWGQAGGAVTIASNQAVTIDYYAEGYIN